MVTTRIEVTDLTVHQVPYRTNSHLCQVVAAKEATNLERITGRIGIAWVDAKRFHTFV